MGMGSSEIERDTSWKLTG